MEDDLGNSGFIFDHAIKDDNTSMAKSNIKNDSTLQFKIFSKKREKKTKIDNAKENPPVKRKYTKRVFKTESSQLLDSDAEMSKSFKEIYSIHETKSNLSIANSMKDNDPETEAANRNDINQEIPEQVEDVVKRGKKVSQKKVWPTISITIKSKSNENLKIETSLDNAETSKSLEKNIDTIDEMQSTIDNSILGNDIETLRSLNENEKCQETSLVVNPPQKRGRGRPKLTTPRVKPPKKPKINLTKKLSKRTLIKPGVKLTKYTINNTSTRKIPQNRLEEALEMFANPEHPIWDDHNISCNTGIHRHWDSKLCLTSHQNLKIKLARQFLLRRDWISLSKVLCLSTYNIESTLNKTYYPLLTKYAALCMAHTDKEQFDKLLQLLIGIDGGSSTVLKKCTRMFQDNEE